MPASRRSAAALRAELMEPRGANRRPPYDLDETGRRAYRTEGTVARPAATREPDLGGGPEALTNPLPRIPAAAARTVYQLQRMRQLSAQAMTKIDQALGRAS